MEFTLALEGVAKDLATSYGIQAMVIPGRPGVYVKGKKLGAIGFHLRRGVVTHGLAININNDLSQFSMISPCGVLGQPVASLQSITGKPVDERDLAGQAWRFVCERLGLEYGALTQF
jgi:lipoyl(octanoyl) transferase